MTRYIQRIAMICLIAMTAVGGIKAQDAKESLIICNEGMWQSDNGQLSFYDKTTGTVTNSWFRKVNGTKLGDTPNDIIQVNPQLIAIAVNWSNIIQFIRPDGKAVGATEDIPNNRRMCVDDEGMLYVTSYAHECAGQTFTKGFVAKIDPTTMRIVGTCEVGWEPEGIRYYKGRLYVANTGGYAYTEGHDYESTVSVVDAATMTKIKDVDTGQINLHGEMSQMGKYLCINSPGDYYDVPAATIIYNCETDQVTRLNIPCTYNATDGKVFYAIGSAYSYYTGEYTFYINTIDPATMNVTEGIGNNAITSKIRSMQQPYSLYVSPYTGNIYFTDAASFTGSGKLYGYTPDGKEIINGERLYVNPGHILAVNPDETGIISVRDDSEQTNGTLHDLWGRKAQTGKPGLYIYNRKKVIVK